MPTRLTKPVTRLIPGEMVISLAADGVRLRRPRGRREVLVPKSLLRELLDAENVRSRDDAMKLAPPLLWCPGRGETVYLAEDVAGRFQRGVVLRVDAAVPLPLIRVAVGPRWERRELTVTLDEVRPLPNAAATLGGKDARRPLLGGK